MSMAPETKAVQIRQLHVKDTGAQPRCDTGIRDQEFFAERKRHLVLKHCVAAHSILDFGFWILD